MPAKLALDFTVLRELANVLGISDVRTKIWIYTIREAYLARLEQVKAKVA